MLIGQDFPSPIPVPNSESNMIYDCFGNEKVKKTKLIMIIIFILINNKKRKKNVYHPFCFVNVWPSSAVLFPLYVYCTTHKSENGWNARVRRGQKFVAFVRSHARCVYSLPTATYASLFVSTGPSGSVSIFHYPSPRSLSVHHSLSL